MNLCLITGKIVSDVKFEFILRSKNISIAIFTLEVDNNSIITVKAYNEMANWSYQNLVKGNSIAIQGSLDSKMQVIMKDCSLLI